MRKFVIKVNGNEYEVEVDEIKTEVSKPATTSIPVAAQAPKSISTPSTTAVGGAAIKAPMPGTILKVNVKAGDPVKKGQTLLVLEAMKMENEIVAPSDGTIEAVLVEKGNQVGAGAVLVSIK
jgi:glutaconyl-CoA/methylmalonyl-CoA decarboxylase subunit gamma